MKLIVAVLLVLAVAVSAAPLADNEYEYLFSRWVSQHGKTYESADEFFKRFNVWKTNMDYILNHGTKGKTYTLKMNKFGDLTNEEFRAMYNGYRGGLKANARPQPKVNTSNLPSSVNWVTQGAVTGVKNQGQCGSCWSFSTTGSVEGVTFIATGKLLSLSEQELVDCGGSTGNQGCNGGMMQDAFQWIINNGGICSEASYPYEGVDDTCRSTQCQNVATISSYVSVTPNSEDALVQAIAGRPTSVAVDAAGSDWQFYSGGVVTDSGCGTSLDHGVLAAGYDTDSSTGQPYYLVKNSWGSDWGENGYIRLLRGSGSGNPGECGIAMDASYPIH